MKKEYAEEVAGRLIEQLEQGTAPWQKPWKPGELSRPFNPTSGKEYRGMNSIWLSMQGYNDPRWMTYKQAKGADAQVRRGEKGTKVVYWKFRDERDAKDENGNRILDENGKPKKVTVELARPRAFHAVVFNAKQIDGLPPLEARPISAEPERHARAEHILSASTAKIEHEPGDRAFYSPIQDKIVLPERKQFDSQDGYYSTALHELGHWSGHSSRLDRDLSHPFGSEGYAREELRAEIASLMLGESLDIGFDPSRHASYVGSWVKALKEDPKEIFRAASDAEKITSYVMDFEKEQVQEQEKPQEQQQAAPEAPTPLQTSQAALIESAQEAAFNVQPLPDEVKESREGIQAYIGALGTSASVTQDPYELDRIEAYLEEATAAENTLDALNRARWTVEHRDSFAENPESIAIGETDSAVEALAIFRSKPDTLIIDNHTGQIEGRTSWVNDGSFPEWSPSIELSTLADMEEQGIKPPQGRQGVSKLDVNVAEALMIAKHPNENDFEKTLLAREAAAKIAEAFGPPDVGIRASKLPEGWTGEVRVTPIVLEGDYQSGDITGRSANVGETPDQWVVETRDADGEWHWFSNDFDYEGVQAKTIVGRLETIADMAGLAAKQEKQEDKAHSHSLASNAPTTTAATHIEHTPPEKPTMGRQYLAVPFREKEQAKAAAKDAGFRIQWDREAKAWYAPEGADLGSMARWKPDAEHVITKDKASVESVETQFAQALADAGLKLDGMPVMDGQMKRVPVEGDKGGKTSGAYAGHLDGHPGGFIQNHKTGETIHWKPEGEAPKLTDQERARLNAEAAERKMANEAAAQAKHDRTAGIAAALYAEAPIAEAHAYIAKKDMRHAAASGLKIVPDDVSPDLKAQGVRIAKNVKEATELRKDPDAKVFMAGDLLVPAVDTEGKIWNLQTINPRFKGWMRGGRKSGLMATIGHDATEQAPKSAFQSDQPLVIATGVATADSVKRLSGQTTVIAFDDGNLGPTVKALREAYPGKPIIIAADNDWEAEGKPQPNGKPGVNAGVVAARQVAKESGCGLAVPMFREGETGSDWNDLQEQRGDGAKREWNEQYLMAKHEAILAHEKLDKTAHERTARAVDDPTTTADDKAVAQEREKAADTHAKAGGMLGEAMAAMERGRASIREEEGLPDSVNGDGQQVAEAVQQKVETIQGEAAKEQQEIHRQGNPVEAARENAKPKAKAQRRRARDMDIDL